MYCYSERWLFMGPLNSSNRRSNPSLYFHFILRPTAATETDGEREMADEDVSPQSSYHRNAIKTSGLVLFYLPLVVVLDSSFGMYFLILSLHVLESLKP